jgi:4a-hydroxytetrahydrobiopterin dehydratase
LVRTEVFPDFDTAMVWVNRVAALAGQRNHHPDIEIRWNRVTLRLTTHEVGELTEQDWSWAEAANDVLQTRGTSAGAGR